ncbi:hypothetical protein VTN77DRAFT_9138 [Rasamsonia byssochlamydoides]|uniref:uncharacterized protein n=1 Tax=Rasamsonia byssochlamydoides TaxID=89139 RepID=UPI00374232D5
MGSTSDARRKTYRRGLGRVHGIPEPIVGGMMNQSFQDGADGWTAIWCPEHIYQFLLGLIRSSARILRGVCYLIDLSSLSIGPPVVSGQGPTIDKHATANIRHPG